MQLSAKILSKLLNGIVEGDPDVQVSGPSRIEQGIPGTISFLGNLKYEQYIYTSAASIIIVDKSFQPKQPVPMTLIRVDDVYGAIALLLEQFGQSMSLKQGIAEDAIIGERVSIGDSTSIGSQCYISEQVTIGDNCKIYPQVFIGNDVKIGSGTILYPGVRIMHGCNIGANCVIHSNAVIGSDGFGFAPQPDGSYKKIPQSGGVLIEDHVEIGANTCVDRGSMGTTTIRAGVKLDNLIHVAHNVEIGTNTVMAAQVGIAGSTKIGEVCQIGGQVGFAGHVSIADGTMIQAQSGIASNINEPGSKLFGSPAINYNNYIKSYAVFKNLPNLYRHIHQLEKKLNDLEKNISS